MKRDTYLIITNVFVVGVFVAQDVVSIVLCLLGAVAWAYLYMSEK